MNKTFLKDFSVRYYEIDKYQKATLLTLLNYMEESAICHSEYAGFGVSKLKSMKRGWVLSRWLIEIDKYPCLGDTVTVETWPSCLEKFYSIREFLLWDKSGQAMVRARSLWVFLDIDRRRPVRIPAEFGEAYGINDKKALDREFSDFKPLENYDASIRFTVRRSDIDTNDHVNNARYVEWMLEAIPGDVYESSSPIGLEVIYRKETGFGGSVISKCSINGNNTNQYLHSITDAETGIELAAAITTWAAKR